MSSISSDNEKARDNRLAGRAGKVKGNAMIVPNVDASFYPNEPQLRRVSPAARKQMGMGPEIEPFSPQFGRRLLETIRHDDDLRAALAEVLGGGR